MAIFLAVYAGPCGPISREFEANDIRAAWAHVARNNSTWYDDAEDALALEPDAPADTIAQAIRAAGYRPLPAGSDPTWDLYYLARVASDWWAWYGSGQTILDADRDDLDAAWNAWCTFESDIGPAERPRP